MKWRSGLTVGIEDLTRVVNRLCVKCGGGSGNQEAELGMAAAGNGGDEFQPASSGQ